MTTPEQQMSAIELARLFADMGDGKRAITAYTLAMTASDTLSADRLEAACAVLQYGDDYKSAYDTFLKLYGEEKDLRGDILGILTEAFYAPNAKKQEKQYKKNCKLLKTYPYLFRKDFPDFAELPVKFFPYDDDGVLPFFTAEERFDPYIDVNYPEVTHYFFRDLTKPIFAREIFSQYELEYLKDNVRRSDWVAKENHIYLHYADWGEFCSYLALLDMKPLLEDEKFVFLIGEEESLYPIDFKERFGIDYSQYPVKTLSVREFHKLIWHTQLSYHNGGDFFNEVMHDHPNILHQDSCYLDDMTEMFVKLQKTMQETADSNRGRTLQIGNDIYNPELMRELLTLKKVTLKDALVGFYLSRPEHAACLDKGSRIVPALFLQPHFSYQKVNWVPNASGGAVMEISGWEEVQNSEIFQSFKYVKTFSPMRRPTTSLAAGMRYVVEQIEWVESGEEQAEKTVFNIKALNDLLLDYMLNRSFMVDGKDHLYSDSRLVRFEDGKLNPAATFTALAEFLDVPYTESMTYCSDVSGKNPRAFANNVVGFDTASVYRTYDAFADENERALLEYAMREVYEHYGYGFHYYDGKEMTEEELQALMDRCTTIYGYAQRAWDASREHLEKMGNEDVGEKLNEHFEDRARSFKEQRRLTLQILKKSVQFYSKSGNPMHYMRMLEPKAELIVQEPYR